MSDAFGSKNLQVAWFWFSFIPALHSHWHTALAIPTSSAIDRALMLLERLDEFPPPPTVCPAQWLLADIDAIAKLAELAGFYVYASTCDIMSHPERARALARAAGSETLEAFHNAGSLALPETLRLPQLDCSETIHPLRLGIGMMLAISEQTGAGVVERIRLKLPTDVPITFDTTNFSSEDYAAWNTWMDGLYASHYSQ